MTKKILLICAVLGGLCYGSETFAFESCWQKHHPRPAVYAAPLVAQPPVYYGVVQVPTVVMVPVQAMVARPVYYTDVVVPNIQYVTTPIVNYQTYRVYNY